MPPVWLAQGLAEVPPGDGWLGARERAVLAGLRMERRRADWRLGRWAAKSLLGDPRIEVLAADDGAPEAWLGDHRLALSVSISHRAGLAVAAAGEGAVGCDLELVEPRSDAFVGDWLAAGEQAAIAGLQGAARDRAVNAIWTAKEAAAKVRRAGLRLDVRDAVATLAPGPPARWLPARVEWRGEGLWIEAWWRAQGRWVLCVASVPADGPPVRRRPGPPRG